VETFVDGTRIVETPKGVDKNVLYKTFENVDNHNIIEFIE